MNWFKFALTILQLGGPVLAGIENIAAEKDTATKRQMAHDSLLLASGVAAAVDPKDTATIQAASDLAHSVIDLHVQKAAAAAS